MKKLSLEERRLRAMSKRIRMDKTPRDLTNFVPRKGIALPEGFTGKDLMRVKQLIKEEENASNHIG